MALSVSVSVAKRVSILCSNGTKTGLQELVPVSTVLYKDAKMSEKSPGGGGTPAFCVRSIDGERMKGYVCTDRQERMCVNDGSDFCHHCVKHLLCQLSLLWQQY